MGTYMIPYSHETEHIPISTLPVVSAKVKHRRAAADRRDDHIQITGGQPNDVQSQKHHAQRMEDLPQGGRHIRSGTADRMEQCQDSEGGKGGRRGQ